MLTKEKSGDVVCPITGVISLLNRKWILSILKDLFNGKSHFNEFKENKPGLSSVVLSDTLKYLEQNGIIIKKLNYNQTQKNTEYILSPKGKKLNIILYEMTLYGLEELECVKATEKEKEKIKKEYEELFKIR